MNKETQHRKILAYLKQNHLISPMDAWNNLRITKLSTRIGEMKKMGYEFGDEWVDGTDSRFKHYWLISEPERKV